MDPNVARLIERTRARRAGLRDGPAGSPLPSERERSPLKERNAGPSPSRLRSPAKAASSPSKAADQEESPSNTIRRLLSRESLTSGVQELLQRPSPGRTVTKTVITEREERTEKKEIVSYSGNRAFLERVEGGEVDSATFSRPQRAQARTVTVQVDRSPRKESPRKESPRMESPRMESPRKESLRKEVLGKESTRKESPRKESLRKESPHKESPHKARESPRKGDRDIEFPEDLQAGRRMRLANLANKFKNIDDVEEEQKEEVRVPRSPVKPPPRAPSPSKHAPVRTDHLRRRSVSPTKGGPMQFISPAPAPSPAAPPALASPVGPGFRSMLASKAVANVTAAGYGAASPELAAAVFRSVSPHKAPSQASDPAFISSLKAQGFQETSSKTRLVYDFDNKKKNDEEPEERTNYAENIFLKADSASRGAAAVEEEEEEAEEEEGPRDQLSPMRASAGPARGRSPSPVRGNLFLQRDQERGRRGRPASPGRLAAREASPSKWVRAASPVRVASPVKAKAASPVKTKAASPVRPRPFQPVAAGPPKPSRTFAPEGPQHPVDTLQAKSMKQKRSMFEGAGPPSAERPDPSSISLAQRKALFEKVKSVPTPIARFGESVTPAMLARSRPATTTETPGEAWKRKRAASPSRPVSPSKPGPSREAASPAPRQASPRREAASRTPRQASPRREAAGFEDRQRRLVAASTPDWRDNDIAVKAQQEKQAEMDLLLNRYRHLRQEPEVPEARSEPAAGSREKVPEKYYPGVNSMKRVKVSPPKEGNLYPKIDFDSESDRAESAMSSDTLDDSYGSQATTASEAPSLGREIVSAARQGGDQELHTIPEGRPGGDDSMETDEGDGLTDSVLEAALEEEEDDMPTPPKVAKTSTSSSGSDRGMRSESTTSWEFHTPTPRDRPQQDSKFKTPMIVNSPLAVASPAVEVEGAAGALLHTVSFYRAQKPATPLPRVAVEPRLERRLEPAAESPRASLGQRIRRLEEEAAQQMPVIQQASSALNLCRATKEFFGSAEQVEGERLLLVASHKRAAALTHIQHLKTEGGLGADPRQEAGAVRGTVSLSGITLGLKRDFVQQLRTGEGGDFVHFFLCLVKCAGQVIPTTMVATADGLDNGRLHFPNLIKFRDLSKDFTIQLEVYGLQTKKEVLPHEAKYHIAGAGSRPGGFLAQLTPKMKFSKTESRLARPAVSSPGGPHSVRTSSFAMVGQAAVTISSLAETAWRLASVPPISPLDGALQIALNGHSESQVAHRGFLTMFDEASGIGVWHRRWLVLEGNTLSYWKYPENEAKQDPIGRVDLAQCVTEVASLAPREVCSRLHTFMLETARREGRAVAPTRHLLSADSRPERLVWCDSLNRALENLRAWDSGRHRTNSGSSLDSDTTSQASSTSTEIW